MDTNKRIIHLVRNVNFRTGKKFWTAAQADRRIDGKPNESRRALTRRFCAAYGIEISEIEIHRYICDRASEAAMTLAEIIHPKDFEKTDRVKQTEVNLANAIREQKEAQS